MKMTFLSAALLAGVSLTACSEPAEPTQTQTSTAANGTVSASPTGMTMAGGQASTADQQREPGAVHTASGTVTAVSETELTISHGPVESLGWPAMTMPFKVETARQIQGVKVGDTVTFSFRQEGSQYVLTSVQPR